MDIFYKFKYISISISDYLLTYKRLFPILELPKSKSLVHQARLARSSCSKNQPGKLSDRQQRVLHLCG